ncbi:MAG: hypothetical protein LBT21_08060 [Oscillospiraceae bacterium]|jgi:tetratricopeptide (TPR) repeat protein|nr:hypothetical protein [Oscillospiraceae bacterium]
MAVANFYEMLEVSPGEDLEKIQYILKGKIQDEENNDFTDGHKERLAKLKEAECAFKSEKSREHYDKSLQAQEEKTVSVDNARDAVYEKWLPTVYEYYIIGHFDAAKTAYENAVSGGNPDLENSEVFEFAARINVGTGELSEALKFINKAVVGQPNDARFLVRKSDILSIYETKPNGGRTEELIETEKKTLDLAVQIATANNDTVSLGEAYNNLAFVWYNRGGHDRDKAKEYAEKALAISRDLPDAQKVLQDIYDKRNAHIKSDIRVEKSKKNSADNVLKEVQALDKQIADQLAKIAKSKKMKMTFGIGIGVAIFGFIMLFVMGAGALIFLIGGIIVAVVGNKMKGFVDPNKLTNLQSRRTNRNNDYNQKLKDYENFRKNLQMRYKNFCAGFKEASEKYGINYVHIDQAYLNDAFPTAPKSNTSGNAPAPAASAFCVSCGAALASDDVFCQGCGARRE